MSDKKRGMMNQPRANAVKLMCRRFQSPSFVMFEKVAEAISRVGNQKTLIF